MSLQSIMDQDQRRVFGDPKEFGEQVTYTDATGAMIEVGASVERTLETPKSAAGYGAAVGQRKHYVWVPISQVPTVTVGVDKIRMRLIQNDPASLVDMVVVAVMGQESVGAWRLECER